MGKKGLEIADSVVQSVFDFIILFIGVAIFLFAVFMYISGQYLNCQCLLLMLLICLMKNWKDYSKRRDKKQFNEIKKQEEKNESI
jgi:Flp pilus assembly protein TadB